MGIAGYPFDPSRRDGDEGPGSGAPPPDDWNAEFTAIVSGISGSMRWEVTESELDDKVAEQQPTERPSPYPIAPDGIWADAVPDTAESRRLRRELRRRERAEALAAHLAEQAEREAEMAADDEHFVPPPPPPLPKLRRRTVGALLLIAAGILLLAWPSLLPASFELIMVLALALILGGAAILVVGMRHRRGDPGDGWDDGAEV